MPDPYGTMTCIHGANSFLLHSNAVELAVTEEGGHMAPVTFLLPKGRKVSPYALAPWLPDECPEQPALLRQLRGDFFCFPFGPQTKGPPHGECANALWTKTRQSNLSLVLTMDTSDTGAHIEKSLSLHPDHTAIYCEHLISGVNGRFNYGTHPILDLSHSGKHQALISTSPFHWASIYPGLFSNPKDGANGALKPGATFYSLDAVPLANGGTTDLSRYPARHGSDDLVMLANDPNHLPFAWTAAVLDGYVWFSLKNPADFPATLLWLSNGGRTAKPWNGRHLGRIGLEEVCSHFSDGPDIARENLLEPLGIPTTRSFSKSNTTRLPVIHAVAATPDGFGKTTSITPTENAVILRDESGMQITTPLHWQFILNSSQLR